MLTKLASGEEYGPIRVVGCPHLLVASFPGVGGQGLGRAGEGWGWPWPTAPGVDAPAWEGRQRAQKALPPPPELTDAGTEAQGGAMACPRTDSGLGEPHLWVPRPPGLPINAGVRLSLEGPASTLNGPSAGLHTCPSPPPASTLPPPALPGGPSRRRPVQKGGRRDTLGVTRWPGWPLWSQVKRYVRISRPIRIRPPPGQPAASSAQRGCPGATATGSTATACHMPQRLRMQKSAPRDPFK